MQVLDRIEKKQRLREAEGYLELLAALGERNRPQLAMRRPIIERVLALLPVEADFGTRESRALFLRGQALRMIDEFALAIENLSLASGLEPQNLSIWLALGWCHKRMGRLDLAIEALEEALAIDSSQAIVHYNLACYWSLAGNPAFATGYLSHAFELNPDYRDLVDSEKDFDPIRRYPEFRQLTSVVV